MPIPEYGNRPTDLSVIGKIEARVILETRCRPPTRVLTYNNFDITTSTLLLFIFSSGMRNPAVVVKLCRNLCVIKREYENLCLLQSRAPGLAPVPLFFETIDSFAVLAMKAVAGRRISGWDEQVALFPVLVDRLIAFHRALGDDRPTPGSLRNEFLAPFAEIASMKQDSSVTATYQRIAAHAAGALEQIELLKIPQHGDFYFDNVLLSDNHIMIVDWEDFGQVQVPGYDLFCLYLNFYRPWDERQLACFFDDSHLVQSIRNGVQAYFRAFSLPYDLAPEFLAFTLLQQYLHSVHQGRSSAEMLWQRLAAYIRHSEQFASMMIEA